VGVQQSGFNGKSVVAHEEPLIPLGKLATVTSDKLAKSGVGHRVKFGESEGEEPVSGRPSQSRAKPVV
jgi:hypothetical protein